MTSAIKGEGKTTTVINLGYTLARDFGKRVLLLDCDFVFPELQYFSETPAQYGLVDCFRDRRSRGGGDDLLYRYPPAGSCRRVSLGMVPPSY